MSNHQKNASTANNEPRKSLAPQFEALFALLALDSSVVDLFPEMAVMGLKSP
mgnify:CR=1 FL=1